MLPLYLDWMYTYEASLCQETNCPRERIFLIFFRLWGLV
jgi:hypothetical protein